MNQLRITEIFYSLQGESVAVGLPTVFIRLTGCPLRCQYCDTAYAFSGGEKITIPALLERVASFDCRQICVTGGEPLAQPHCLRLLTELSDAAYRVSLETSGALDLTGVDPRVMIIMDLKTPGSNEVERNKIANIALLKPSDQIKFVICHRDDYDWAKGMIVTHQLVPRVQLLFSPSWGQLDPTLLANWILEDKLPVRFQLQLHKLLWNDAKGH